MDSFSFKVITTGSFDPNKNPSEQYPLLHQAVIRNNKQEVTDLNGNKLFQAPKTINLQYTYTQQEEFSIIASKTSFLKDGLTLKDYPYKKEVQ